MSNHSGLSVYDSLELREKETRKKCEWCDEYLPNTERYHLEICPRCRKEAIDAFLKGKNISPEISSKGHGRWKSVSNYAFRITKHCPS